MKIRTHAAAFVVAAAATLSLTGVAAAQPADRDCPDFATQAEAQAALDSAIGDPERLDRDGDGIACDSEFADGPRGEEPADEESDDEQIAVAPRGGVDTGDGSGAALPVVLGGLGAAAVGATALGAMGSASRRRG